MKNYKLFLYWVLLFLPIPTFAHGGHGTGFTAGFTHPIFGLDHLVAIIGVGVLSAAFLKGKAWLYPLLFVGAMAIGGWLGIEATPFGITEWIIGFSVLLTGLLLAAKVAVPIWAYASLFAIFGFFHGHAHGTEMPIDSNVPLYIVGFVVGASLLAIIGIGGSKLINKELTIRLVGAFIAGMGMMMLLA